MLALLAGAGLGAPVVLITASRLERPWPIVVAFVAAGATLALAAVVDAVEERIPNRLLALSLGLLVLAPVTVWQPGALAAVVAGLLLGGAPMLVVLLTRGIGVGDVKLAAVLGATAALVHPLAALATIFVTALASSTYAAARRVRRLALGPWLWSGFAICTLVASLVLEGRT